MTLNQKKARQLAEALDALEAFKEEWKKSHPDGTEEEFQKATARKAEELDL